MLRAEELMVGDWVLYGEKPVRIIQLSEGKDYKEIHPIPLTPEILEKNGFTYYGESWYIPHDDKNKRESVMVGFHMYCTVINITKGNNAYYKEVPCKYRCCAENRRVYVHELQHALRLCGIDKTIEL